MLRSNVPRAIRVLRLRRRWRQGDLATRSRVSVSTVSRIERGLLRGVPVTTILRLAESLDATVDVMVRWEGAGLDRLFDAAHAALTETTAGMFGRGAWDVRTEVSFNHFGDRGRVDLLAWHQPTAVLAVVEIKTAIGDLQETIGRLDVKSRLGVQLAAGQRWPRPSVSLPVLVVGDARRERSTVAEHPAMLARFELRGRQARAWVGHPSRPTPAGLLWFTTVPDSHGTTVIRHRRVRRPDTPG